jgi:hypothetical protein
MTYGVDSRSWIPCTEQETFLYFMASGPAMRLYGLHIWFPGVISQRPKAVIKDRPNLL